MSAEAQNNMADAKSAYLRGDYRSAFDLWIKEAEAGNAEAQSWIGSLYANGEGVDVDDAKALNWYLAAARQGNHMAQANVGAFYFMGRGTARDVQEALHWLTLAADGGDLNGCFNLAEGTVRVP